MDATAARELWERTINELARELRAAADDVEDLRDTPTAGSAARVVWLLDRLMSNAGKNLLIRAAWDVAAAGHAERPS